MCQATVTKTTTSTTTTQNVPSQQQQQHSGKDNNGNNDKGNKAKKDENTMGPTSVMQNDKSASSSASSWSRFWNLTNDILLTINAMSNIPMYFMIVSLLVFYTTVICTNNLWLRTTFIAYQVYALFLDTKPHGVKPRFIAETLQPFFNKTQSVRNVGRYFDCQLHKTSELVVSRKTAAATTTTGNDAADPKQQKMKDDEQQQKFIFTYHPHGVIGMGASMGLMTDACGFDQLFPEVHRRSGVTLNATFWVPFFREWLLSLGMCSANKSTLHQRLNDGESLVLIPGGAAEALHAHPGVMKLSIQHRKGFVKLAMETKSALVPCLGFGENEIFDTIYNKEDYSAYGEQAMSTTTTTTSATTTAAISIRQSLLRLLWRVQVTFKQFSSFSLPIWTNVIPKRGPINVVVGEPLKFDDDDSQKLSVDECHAMYLTALSKLYDEHKAKYGYETVALEFV